MRQARQVQRSVASCFIAVRGIVTAAASATIAAQAAIGIHRRHALRFFACGFVRRLFRAHRRHHALREACGYVLVLQLAEGGVQGRQLTEQPSAFLAFAHMSEHLRTLLLRQLSVNKGREQRRKFFTFLHIAFLSPPTV